MSVKWVTHGDDHDSNPVIRDTIMLRNPKKDNGQDEMHITSLFMRENYKVWEPLQCWRRTFRTAVPCFIIPYYARYMYCYLRPEIVVTISLIKKW